MITIPTRDFTIFINRLTIFDDNHLLYTCPQGLSSHQFLRTLCIHLWSFRYCVVMYAVYTPMELQILCGYVHCVYTYGASDTVWLCTLCIHLWSFRYCVVVYAVYTPMELQILCDYVHCVYTYGASDTVWLCTLCIHLWSFR